MRVEIVLEYDQQGKAPDGSQIERFIQDAFTQRAVTHEDTRDIAAAAQLFGKRYAGRDRNDAALNPVAEDIGMADVLAAAAPAADAPLAAHDLGEESGIIFGAGEIVPVAAVVAEDGVLGTKMLGEGDARPFLSYAGVYSPK